MWLSSLLCTDCLSVSKTLCHSSWWKHETWLFRTRGEIILFNDHNASNNLRNSVSHSSLWSNPRHVIAHTIQLHKHQLQCDTFWKCPSLNCWRLDRNVTLIPPIPHVCVICSEPLLLINGNEKRMSASHRVLLTSLLDKVLTPLIRESQVKEYCAIVVQLYRLKLEAYLRCFPTESLLFSASSFRNFVLSLVSHMLIASRLWTTDSSTISLLWRTRFFSYRNQEQETFKEVHRNWKQCTKTFNGVSWISVMLRTYKTEATAEKGRSQWRLRCIPSELFGKHDNH